MYEDYETEQEIYDEVTDYNQSITDKNETIQDQNDALEDDLNADCVDSIGDVGENNSGVVVDQETLDILNGYDTLKETEAALQQEAAALDSHAGKDAQLGSDAYAEYLAAVEAYNDKVTQYNADVDAYNEAVQKYNAAVEAYNASQSDDSSTSAEGNTDTGTADWGNINITDRTTFGHIDVKYTAAVGKDKTEITDSEGNTTTTYSDKVTQYTVTGVYVNEEAAKNNPNSYGVTYVNKEGGTTNTQSLIKETTEFRTSVHNSASLDPDEGTITFYMTLADADGNTHGISIELKDTDVYPEGTYFAGKDNGKLSDFRDSNGKALPTVVIDGVTYYDLSGQSVFVISALACNGARTNNGKISTDGLDLVLNVQTLIDIHQAKNANTLSYLDYELGKTAQATAPTDPGDGPDAPDVVADPGDAPIEPIAPIPPDVVEDPGEAPIEPIEPIAPDVVEDPGDAPIEPIAPIPPRGGGRPRRCAH